MNALTVGIILVIGSISVFVIAYSPGLFCCLVIAGIILLVFLAVLSDINEAEYPQSKVNGSQSKIVNNYGIVHGKTDITNNYGIVHDKE